MALTELVSEGYALTTKKWKTCYTTCIYRDKVRFYVFDNNNI